MDYRENKNESRLKIDSENKYSEIIDQNGLSEFIDELQSTPEQMRRFLNGYIDSGAEKDAFKYGEFVVKTARHESGNIDEHFVNSDRCMSEQASPLLVGVGIPKLEQLIALSDEDEVMVTTLMPGVNMTKIPVRNIFTISKKHLLELDSTLSTMNDLNLHPHNLGGVLYDKKNGFSFVDYECVDNDKIRNRGDISNTESFLHYMLANPYRKNFYGADATGLRALARNVVMRRFKSLLSADS